MTLRKPGTRDCARAPHRVAVSTASRRRRARSHSAAQVNGRCCRAARERAAATAPISCASPRRTDGRRRTLEQKIGAIANRQFASAYSPRRGPCRKLSCGRSIPTRIQLEGRSLRCRASHQQRRTNTLTPMTETARSSCVSQTPNKPGCTRSLPPTPDYRRRNSTTVNTDNKVWRGRSLGNSIDHGRITTPTFRKPTATNHEPEFETCWRDPRSDG